MAKDILDYSAFVKKSPKSANERIAEATSNGQRVNFGYIPRNELSSEQKINYDAFKAESPLFNIRGHFGATERRYALWNFGVKLLGRHLYYSWQQTGSCVGSGGYNLLQTSQAIELFINGKTAKDFLEIWWLYVYGRSRFHAGLRGEGEGSWEGAWKKAILEDGHFELDPAGAPDLPDPKLSRNWYVQPASIEYDWSDGAKIPNVFLTLGRKHLYRTAAYLKNADQVRDSIINGYPVAQASMFGFSPMVPRVQGTKAPIRLVTSWNGSWSHKTWFDEFWDHPEFGQIFRFGNNWGPGAHGEPMQGEPTGGTYITFKIMDQICKDSDSEVVAYSPHDGFPAREEELLDYSAFPTG